MLYSKQYDGPKGHGCDPEHVVCIPKVIPRMDMMRLRTLNIDIQ